MNLQSFPSCCGAYTISNWESILSGEAVKAQADYLRRMIAGNEKTAADYQRKADTTTSEPHKTHYLQYAEQYKAYNVRHAEQLKQYENPTRDPFVNVRKFLDTLHDTGAYITTMSAEQYNVYEPVMTEYGFMCIEAGNPVHGKNAFYVLVKIVHKAKNPKTNFLDNTVKVG